ncbi:acyl carrier protein [Steroidobacter agaridevorans]|uniref:Acyl carrier protein n=1 Tax=Steroidobacter agaridevorans TaxID=2695856 RepID=A0A829YFH6_9GAMM|nr:acyl carrier protein [Steroidobacter agaridevorans]GFE82165.1 acyl carrier protein [Steroidobacter agaridevorans]GFE85447.1 acyl carrier protein [Steroidobacter agaridevorans]
MHDIKKTVRSYILENFLMGDGGEQLTDDRSFLDHHIIDSTGFIELVTFLESTYRIRIADEEMLPENLDSLENVARFVASKTRAA